MNTQVGCGRVWRLRLRVCIRLCSALAAADARQQVQGQVPSGCHPSVQLFSVSGSWGQLTRDTDFLRHKGSVLWTRTSRACVRHCSALLRPPVPGSRLARQAARRMSPVGDARRLSLPSTGRTSSPGPRSATNPRTRPPSSATCPKQGQGHSSSRNCPGGRRGCCRVGFPHSGGQLGVAGVARSAWPRLRGPPARGRAPPDPVYAPHPPHDLPVIHSPVVTDCKKRVFIYQSTYHIHHPAGGWAVSVLKRLLSCCGMLGSQPCVSASPPRQAPPVTHATSSCLVSMLVQHLRGRGCAPSRRQPPGPRWARW